MASVSSRIAASAFRLKTPSTGIPPPPQGPLPPPWTGISPLWAARNVAIAGAAGLFGYWSYTRVIMPRVNATFRPAPVAESRIEVLASPIAAAVQVDNTAPTHAAAAEDAPQIMSLPHDEPGTTASSVAQAQPTAVDSLTPPPPSVRGDPWWLKWLPLTELLEIMGLSPWPFDYGDGQRRLPATPHAANAAEGPSAAAGSGGSLA